MAGPGKQESNKPLRRFALLVNRERDSSRQICSRIQSYLEAHGASYTEAREKFASCDAALSLGGDGTFLSLAHIEALRGIPCIGVNLGSVGFLTEIEVPQLEHELQRMLTGDYQLEERLMVAMQLYDESGRRIGSGTALNDLVLTRLPLGRIISLDLSINDVPVEKFRGDGLILATPTGSTAYSLAAGGPIVYPALPCLLITPICPHSLHNRSYLAPPDAVLRLRLTDPEATATVSLDGQMNWSLGAGYLTLQRASASFLMVRLDADHFYETLPKKIQERGALQ